MKNFIICILFFFIGLTACKKEKIVEVEKPVYITPVHHWSPVTIFDTYAGFKNAGNAKYIGNGQILFNCEGQYALLDSAMNDYHFGSNILANEIQKTPNISDKFFVSCSSYNAYISINPTKDIYNGLNGDPLNFSMHNIDPAFSDFNFYGICWWQHSEILSTPKNKLLISYLDTSGAIKLLIMQLKITNWVFPGYDQVDSSYTKNITAIDLNYAFTTVGNIGENLFYHINTKGTYRINYNNDTIRIGNYALYDPFEANGKFYSIAYDIGVKLKESSDSGMTWQDVCTGLPSVYQSFNYFNMDGKAFASYNSQLFEVVFGSGTLTFKELNNEGLSGNVITSVNKCNNRIIVSTKSGIYYCNYSEFYQYK